MSRALLALSVVLVAAGVRWGTSTSAPHAVRERRAPPTASAIERGRLVYAAYGCAMCHGADGKGGFANPNSETDGKVPGLQMVKEGYLPRELVQKILDGAPRIGKADAKGPVPPYRMPGWRDRMTRADADDLVQYLFSLYPKSAEEKWR
jgi:mono/diheme cytochrome c family protein